MGALVEALQWWRSDEGELALAMATAELLELGGCVRGCCGRRRRSRGNAKWSAGGVGRSLAMLMARSGRPGRGGQGAGDARPLRPPRGARVLPVSATDD